MNNFDALGLPESLMHTLQNMQFYKPTPIQAQAIPLAIKGKDILGSAQTGTGKTAAFGIPLLVKLMKEIETTALVMAPTRELASQVVKQLQIMAGKKSSIRACLLIGGEPMHKQLRQLKNKPRLIVVIRHCLSLLYTRVLVRKLRLAFCVAYIYPFDMLG